ncbi:MAG: bile acid:sodium symporter [Syntrophobacterales bacterium]|nr:MAG: bile acid:sodium symporter [Syntrophobacterales bacterium]
MFSPRDFLLLAVSFGSLLAGILAPEACAPLQPYPVVFMMMLLFLSFLSIRISQIWDTARQSPRRIAWFLLFRMILFPVAVALLFRLAWPAYGLSALLLAGISTGAVAPFFANLLQANMALVLVVVVASSLLVPFTLPPLVAFLFGHSMEIPLLDMMRLLIMVVFIPLAAAEVLKKAAPRAVDLIRGKQYPLSLILFAMTNLSIFSKFADFFRQNILILMTSISAAFLIGAISIAAGILVAWRWTLPDQLASGLSLWIMHYILVIVFSAPFFSPLEPTVAALYTLPFYAMVVPVRAWRNYRMRTGSG